MQRHTKNYMKHFGYGIDDVILCEMCRAVAVDIHHIEGRMKGNAKLDEVENCIALCRKCHDKAHANAWGYGKDELKTRHLNIIEIHKS